MSIFAAVGACGLPILYREYQPRLAKITGAEKTIFVALAALPLAYLFHRLAYNTGAFNAGDTDSYHLQIVRWYNEFGAVCGVGNLNAHFAFNTSYLSFAALLDNWIWDARSAWLAPSLTFAGGFLYFTYELIFARQAGGRFYAGVMIFYLLSAIRPVGLYYDEPVHLLNAVVILEAYYRLNRRADENAVSPLMLLLLAAAAFTIKPIGAVSLIFAGLLTLFLLRREAPTVWLKTLLPAVIAVSVWVVRNLIMSGYPLHPLPIFALPFDWTLPVAEEKAAYDGVAWSYRMPDHEVLARDFWSWFKPWLTNYAWTGYFGAMAIFPLAIATILWGAVARFRRSKEAGFFFLWMNANLLYWLVSAPLLRYGAGFFWVNLAAALLLLNPVDFWNRAAARLDWQRRWRNRIFRYALVGGWIFAIAAILIATELSAKRSLIFIGKKIAHPMAEYTINATPPFKVWIPTSTDDVLVNKVGNSPLPSMASPKDNIEMRAAGNLGKGFRPRSVEIENKRQNF